MDWKAEAIERHKTAISEARSVIDHSTSVGAETNGDSSADPEQDSNIEKQKQAIAAHEAVIEVLRGD